MTKDLEARLLASVPTIGHFQRLEEFGVTEQSFQHYGPIYHYIAEIIAENNHLPRLRDLKETFNIPDHVRRQPEEYDWLLDEFLKITTVQRIQQTLERSVEAHSENPKELLPDLIRGLTELLLPGDRTASLTDQSTLQRFLAYEQRAIDTNLITGIPTGIRHFDAEYRLGWLAGEVNGIVGRLYIGKSWLLIHFGALAWLAGARILFISPEMPKEEAEARFDTLICGLHEIPVNVTDFYRGYKPTPAQQAIAERISKRGDWITISSDDDRAFRIGELPRLVRQFSPQVLLIDGLPLLEGDRQGNPLWEQVKNISYGLKNLAVGMNLVILVSHQANRSAFNTTRPPGLHEISYGDAFAQACDRIIVLSKPQRKPDILRLTIQKFRKGKPLQVGTDFEFDPEHGRIRELAEHSGTPIEQVTLVGGELVPIP